MRWTGPDGYWVSDEKSLVDQSAVHRWMSEESYWAKGRAAGVTTKANDNSLVLGLYAPGGSQAGFARFVTDYATFAWLCDVFISQDHRGRGLGSFLVQTSVEHPAVRDVRQILMADPGRSLYQRYGYGGLVRPERWMERPGPAR